MHESPARLERFADLFVSAMKTPGPRLIEAVI